jgi:hypothetical protein
MDFVRGLHIGADAAEPQQVDRRLQDGGHQRSGSMTSASMPSATRISGEGDFLLAARDDGRRPAT